MAERKRSHDGKSETSEILGMETAPTPDQQGSGAGEMARKIGMRDEEKRSVVRPGGATRVEGADKRHEGIKQSKKGGV